VNSFSFFAKNSLFIVNPVRNSSRYDSKPSGALNPAGIVIKPNPAAEQRGIISNGVNSTDKQELFGLVEKATGRVTKSHEIKPVGGGIK
jgi:hypothetical protein